LSVQVVDPISGESLQPAGPDELRSSNASYPVVRGVPRLCEASNYTQSFGLQWNMFRETQIDSEQVRQSEIRFFAETGWAPEDLDGLDILEVGSGAGRFSRVILERTNANLWSVDYSSAVDANMATNGAIAPDRFRLFQASIYELPFPDDSFDKVVCLGVLQHTPDFEASVRSLIAKCKVGGEIVVDFYPIRGFWTKIHAKYLLRPITKRMDHQRLLRLIDRNADGLIALSRGLRRVGLNALNRFVPMCDIQGTLPPGLTDAQLREWVVLDTFDMFSPEFDNPQRISRVERMFRDNGADVTFAGYVHYLNGKAAVVRAIKKQSQKAPADGGEPARSR
jgi:SAM-dependent methyltransferase